MTDLPPQTSGPKTRGRIVWRLGRAVLLAVLLFLGPLWYMGKPFGEAVDEIQGNIARIVSRLKATLGYPGRRYDLYRAKLADTQIELFYADDRGEPFQSFERLQTFLIVHQRKLKFATNAGIFSVDPKTGKPEPEGLLIQSGSVRFPLNTGGGEGNFYLQPNGVFAIARDKFAIVETSNFATLAGVESATQSGPILVKNGLINPTLNPQSSSRYLRSGVGLPSSSEAIFVISRLPVTFYEFAEFFQKELHCQDALYLDGAISKMYLPAAGRTELGAAFAGIIAVTEKAP